MRAHDVAPGRRNAMASRTTRTSTAALADGARLDVMARLRDGSRTPIHEEALLPVVQRWASLSEAIERDRPSDDLRELFVGAAIDCANMLRRGPDDPGAPGGTPARCALAPTNHVQFFADVTKALTAEQATGAGADGPGSAEAFRDLQAIGVQALHGIVSDLVRVPALDDRLTVDPESPDDPSPRYFDGAAIARSLKTHASIRRSNPRTHPGSMVIGL
jgi:hypothetical protein